MSDDLFESNFPGTDKVARRTVCVQDLFDETDWLPVTTLPDPASKRMVLLWLAAPLNVGTQCIVGFFDHTFGTWRDMDGHVVRGDHVTHWAEAEGPV